MPAESRVSGALHPIEIVKVSAAGTSVAADAAAVEEPLEIRLEGTPFVVIMRTPGADRELAAGFLLAERIIASADDLGTIRHCTDPKGEQAANVVNVTLDASLAERVSTLLEQRRVVTATSACGVCGRRSIEELMTGIDPIAAAWRVPARVIDGIPATLRAAQAAFAKTGGLHAAGLFDTSGLLQASVEDVGRHNTVDKVIGAQLLMDRLPLDDRVLFVSGRAGYEIVQKALVARIAVVASISAPTSLAIDLARQGGITLLGFVRDGGFNIYTGPERIDVS
jgi:FdhD protein